MECFGGSEKMLSSEISGPGKEYGPRDGFSGSCFKDSSVPGTSEILPGSSPVWESACGITAVYPVGVTGEDAITAGTEFSTITKVRITAVQ